MNRDFVAEILYISAYGPPKVDFSKGVIYAG
jgi:hypothetical protein